MTIQATLFPQTFRFALHQPSPCDRNSKFPVLLPLGNKVSSETSLVAAALAAARSLVGLGELVKGQGKG